MATDHNFKVKNGLDVEGANLKIVDGGSGIALVDASGDITLDAGGGDIRLKDDGTQFGRLANFLGSLVITSSATDTAMMIGNTDGSVIMGGHVTLGDNNKSKYGDELEIYSNGTNAYIDEVGGGNLFIRSDEIRLNKYTGEFMLRAIADGAVTLYYDNSAKLATSSTGISVTGGIAATGDVSLGNQLTISGTGPTLYLTDTNHNPDYYIQNSNGTLKIRDVTNSSDRITIGTTGNVGINNTSPTSKLHVVGDTRIGSGDLILVSGNKRIRGSNTNTSSTGTVIQGTITDHSVEQGGDIDLSRFNILAGADRRYTVTVTKAGASSSIGTAVFRAGSNNGGSVVMANATDEFVITIDLGSRNITYTAYVGVVFGNESFRARGVKIETYRNGSYQTECDLTNQTDNIVARQVNGNNANGVSKVRFTFKDPQNTSGMYFRINNLFLINYNTGVAIDGYDVDRYDDVTKYGHLTFRDNSQVKLGNGGDLTLHHDGTNSFIQNNVGSMFIQNLLDDGDVIFQGDDGSGGLAQYFRIDGGLVGTQFEKRIMLPDNVQAQFGTAGDLKIYHTGFDSYIDNVVGHLVIRNTNDNKDIVFQSDDGSGGTADYMRINGTNTNIAVSKTMVFADNSKASFGASEDLRIKHDGTNCFVEAVTGDLILKNTSDDIKILAEDDVIIRDINDSTNMATFTNGGAVTLFHNGNTKIATKSDGVNVTGEMEADSLDVSGNAVISGNLTVSGTTTTVNTTNTVISDALIELQSGLTGANSNDIGLIFERGSTGSNMFVGFDESQDAFVFANTTSTGATTGNVVLDGYQKFIAGSGSRISGQLQIGDTVNQNSYGILQVNQVSNVDEQGIGILSASHARSMRLWVDETNSYVSSGNGGVGQLILNEGGGKVGVGTTALTNKFHVSGNARVEGNLMAGGAAASNVPARPIHVKSAGDAAAIRIEDTTSSNQVFDIRSTQGTGLLFIDVTAGATRMTVTDDNKLHINGAGHILMDRGGELRSKDTSGNEKTLVRINGSNDLEYGYSGSGAVKFMGGGSYTERMRIHTDGNIGIGTQSPQGALDVDGYLRITRNIVSNTVYQMLSLGSDRTVNDYGGLNKDYWRLNIATPGPTTDGGASAHAFGTLIFSGVTGTNTTYADRLAITAAGAVGIGTNTPAGGLHVANSFLRVDNAEGVATKKIRSSYFSNSQNLLLETHSSSNIVMSTGGVGISTSSLLSGVKLDVRGGNIHVGGYGSTGSNFGVRYSSDDGSSHWYTYSDTGGELVFGRSGTVGSEEKVRFDSSGSVIIGGSSAIHSAADLSIYGGASNYVRIALQDQDGTNEIAFIDKSGADLSLVSQNGTSHGTFSVRSFNGTTTAIRLAVNAAGAVTFNSAYTFPISDGSNGQVLISDGSGTLSFGDVVASNSDTVDNLHATSFLRSDANDTATGTLTFNGIVNLNATTNFDASGQQITLDTDGARRIFDFTRNGTLRMSLSSLSNQDGFNFDFVTGSNLQINGNRILTTADEGSGNGLDADTLDTIQASSFLRSDATDTASGDLTFTGFCTFDNDGSPSVKISGDDFAEQLELHRNHSSNAPSIKFTNNGGQIGILYAADTENELKWRDGSTTNNHLIFHEGNSVQFTSALNTKLSGIATGADVTPSWVPSSNPNYLTSSSNLNASNLSSGTIPSARFPDNIFDSYRRDTIDSSSEDFNNYLTTGTYAVNNWSESGDTVANGPTNTTAGDSYPWGVLRVTNWQAPSGSSSGSGTYVLQEYWPHQTDIVYSRIMWNGSFTGWRAAWGNGNDGSGSGLDADLLDGLQNTSFLRSDTADTAGSKITFGAGLDISAGSIDYLPNTGAILKVDGQNIIERTTTNGGITIGHDDAVIIAGGDTSTVMNANINNATETVFIGAEGGLQIYAFPDNDTSWTNRKSLAFDGTNGLNMNSVFTVDISGNLSATTKSFDIEHPTKEGMRLHHGVLEGPEHGVYVRGQENGYIIELPEYWTGLVDEDSITVQLTAIGKAQELYVENIEDNKVYIASERTIENYFYYIQAERKDVDKIEVEYDSKSKV